LLQKLERLYSCLMEISCNQRDGVDVIELAGEIDLHGSPSLRKELQKFLDAKSPVLVADFTQVDYIDSSGLATLIEYVRGASAFSGKFGLFGLQDKVRTIFDLVRLNELFLITDSFEEAQEKLSA